jgi:putative NIF3 family GTP cyclohydrolase 1 type 2
MRFPQRELSGVLASLLDVHPYEEPAYDIYPLRNPGAVFSRGKLGELPLPVSMVTVLGQIEDALRSYGSNRLRSYNVQNRSVRNVAVVSGESDNGRTVQAALRANADVVILGSVSQQDQMMVDGHNTALVDTGYAPSLAPGLERLAAQLRNTFGAEGLRVLCAGRGH